MRNNLILALIFIAGSLTECRTRPSITLEGQPLPMPPANYSPAEATIIPLTGENCCATPTGDKNKIIFLSRGRSRHAHFQIYVFDLAAKKERRLTFHDGDDQGPIYNEGQGLLYYASTTDSLKENPTYLTKNLGKDRPESPGYGTHPFWAHTEFDIYSSRLDGSEIHRHTQQKEFEAEATIHPTEKFLVFTSVHGAKTSLYKRRDGQAAELVTGAAESESEAQFSPSGKDLIWVRYTTDYLGSQIWIKNPKKSPRMITSGHGVKLSPHFSPDGQWIVFASNVDDVKNFEIYSMKRDGTCLGRLTYALGQDHMPIFSKDGASIYFSSNRTGTYQIYIQDYRPPPCL